MKLTPTGAKPPVIQQTMSTTAQTDARAKAIAMISGQQEAGQQATQQTQQSVTADPRQVTENHSINPNNVSAEELGAIQTPKPQENKQLHTDEQAQPQEPVEPTAQTQPDSQYQILARKEKALRAQAQQQSQELKAARDAIKAEKAELERLKAEYSQNYVSKTALKQQTLQALADAGVSYEEVTAKQIDEANISPSMQGHLKRLEERTVKAEQQLEEMRRQATGQQDEAYKAAVRQIQSDVTKLVNSDPAFETIKATRSVKDVVELIEATFKEDGELLSVEDAAQMVEDHLLAEVDKLTRIDKIKKRLNLPPATVASTQTQQPNARQQPQTMKTLTNATSSQRQLSPKERAILAFEGKLKN
jgi:hypothetical protein